MNSRRDRMRMNVEGDRLSSLPDDLIYKILSFISAKDVVELSVLSSRWRYIWTLAPHLDFSRNDFPSQPNFSKFVPQFLTYRNHWVDLLSVKFNVSGRFSHSFVDRILTHVFSYNLQKLTMTCVLEEKIQFSLYCFNSWSLKSLTLIGSENGHSITLVDSWYLPALTTLHLAYVTLTDEKSYLLSNCRNLKNLTLSNCSLIGSNCFTIGECQRSDLMFEDEDWSDDSDVVTPRLKTLSIIKCEGEIQICVPDLMSLIYKSDCSLPVIEDSLPFLEMVNLCICKPSELGARKVVDLLQKFKNAKFLTLSSEIIELLSSSVELISHQPSPFANLTSLKIYPEWLSEEASKEVNMSAEVKNYLLHKSPTATLTLVSREEAKVVRDTTSARNVMAELKVLLDQEKRQMESYKAKMEQRRAQFEKQREQAATKTATHVGRRMKRVWDDLNALIEVGRVKTICISLMLQRIKGLWKNLLTSKRDKMEAHFSRLRIKADTVMNEFTDCMKIISDMKVSCLRDCCRDLGITCQPSSLADCKDSFFLLTGEKLV